MVVPPSHKAKKVDLNIDYNEAPNDLPPGVVTGCNVGLLQPIKGLTWPTYMLNEYHMQIAFIGIGFCEFAGQGL
jgi:hypothetical protein